MTALSAESADAVEAQVEPYVQYLNAASQRDIGMASTEDVGGSADGRKACRARVLVHGQRARLKAEPRSERTSH